MSCKGHRGFNPQNIVTGPTGFKFHPLSVWVATRYPDLGDGSQHSEGETKQD